MADAQQARGRRARDLILGNLHYKLIGLLVALAAWLFVQGEQVVRDRVRASVDWITPVGLVTTEELPSTVVLTVEGPRNAVRKAQRADITLVADLSEASVGEASVDFSTLPVHGLPANLTVEGRSPSSIRFALDQVSTRKVLVEPQPIGTPSPGYQVDSVTVDPAVVEIRGPRMVLSDLVSLQTKPIDVSNLAGTSDFPVELEVPRAVQVISDVQPVARVTVEPLVESLRVSDVPVFTRQRGWVPLTETVAVRLEGPSAAIRELSADDVIAMVHLPDNPQKARYEVPFGPDQGVHLRIVVHGAEDVRAVTVTPQVVEVVRQ